MRVGSWVFRVGRVVHRWPMKGWVGWYKVAYEGSWCFRVVHRWPMK